MSTDTHQLTLKAVLILLFIIIAFWARMAIMKPPAIYCASAYSDPGHLVCGNSTERVLVDSRQTSPEFGIVDEPVTSTNRGVAETPNMVTMNSFTPDNAQQVAAQLPGLNHLATKLGRL